VVQRKRKVGEERRADITEEVAKLKEAGFIEEIKYPLNNGKVRVVKGDQVLARKCYESSLKIRPRPSKSVSRPVSGEGTNGINMVNVTDLDPREDF
jgi:hypothetical protein